MGTSATGKPRAQDRPREGESATPLSEWVAAAIGLLVVLATLACLAWLALSGRDGRVEPAVQVVSIERQGEQHHVRLRVENAGAAPAAALRVQGRLRQGAQVVEEAEVELDYVPARSSGEAGLFFRSDPRRFALELSVRSYREP
jgi:uncharacterized protein (TIGR02588 family)